MNLVYSGVYVTWLLVGLSTNLSSPMIKISIVVASAMNGDTWYMMVYVTYHVYSFVLMGKFWSVFSEN